MGVWKDCLEILADPDVSEIASNGPGKFFVVKGGKRAAVDVPRMTEEEYAEEVRDLTSWVRASFEFDPNHYLFEGPLYYTSGSGESIQGRCHIVLPPAVEFPQVTIAKKSKKLTTLQGIASSGSMSTEMMNFIRSAVRANLTIAISGGTGAGKDLHKDTLIPTPRGNVPLSEISVGDTVYEEMHRECSVTQKYRPLDPRHFKIHFGNGENVRAGQGHLWLVRRSYGKTLPHSFLSAEERGRLEQIASTKHAPVLPHEFIDLLYGVTDIPASGRTARILDLLRERVVPGALDDRFDPRELAYYALLLDSREDSDSVNQSCVMTTEELHDSMRQGRSYKIPGFGASESVSIVSIVEIDDDTNDYYCLGVDSPSRLFLCTESGIPTHNTTMLESLTKLIPAGERVGVAEDTPELVLEQPNVAYVHSVPWRPGMSENEVATLSWVVKQFQRMRIDKIIVGETRGAEFADFLVAANSGMEGSLTTIHANTPARCLNKMTRFAAMGSPGQPTRLINREIAETIDVIVQLRKFNNGDYRVTSIEEVTPVISDEADAGISTQNLYMYQPDTGMFIKTGNISDSLRRKFAEKDVPVDEFLTSRLGEPQHGHAGSPPNRPKSQPMRAHAGSFAEFSKRKL